MCRSSVIIRWTSVFGSPTSSAINRTCNAGPYPKEPSHEPHCSHFLQLKGALRAVRPQRSPFRSWTPCATWRLGLKTQQHPHKLSSTTATFRNQTFRVSRRTWSRKTPLQSPLHFRPWQDTKTTTHFANVPTTTKARGLNWARSNCIPGFPLHLPRPPLSFPGPTALHKKNHSHYVWDRPCTYIKSYIHAWIHTYKHKNSQVVDFSTRYTQSLKKRSK